MAGRFEELEDEAKLLADDDSISYTVKRKRKVPKRSIDDGSANDIIESGKSWFKENVFQCVLNLLKKELEERGKAFKEIFENFGFLVNLERLQIDEIKKSSMKLVAIYKDDLESVLSEEIIHFKQYIVEQPIHSIQDIFHFIIQKQLTPTFPNIMIVCRIFLSMPISNSSCERDFSAMGRIKSEDRASLTQENLNAYSHLYINREIAAALTFEEVYNEFMKKKQRKGSGFGFGAS